MDLQGIGLGALIGLVMGMASERFRASIWERQERWKFKRDIYERLLQALAECRFANLMLQEGKAQLGDQLWAERVAVERKAMDELNRLTPVANLFLSSRAKSAIQEMYDSGRGTADTSGQWREFRQNAWTVFKRAEDTLIVEAKKDLHL